MLKPMSSVCTLLDERKNQKPQMKKWYVSLPCQHLCWELWCGLSPWTLNLAPPEPCTVLHLSWTRLVRDMAGSPSEHNFQSQDVPGLLSTAQREREKTLNGIPRNHIHTRQPREVRSDSHTSWRSYVCWRVRYGDKVRESQPSCHLHVQWLLENSGQQRLEQTHNSW